MDNKEKLLRDAKNALQERRMAFLQAENEAREVLKRILGRAGEDGIKVMDDEYIDEFTYIPLAEREPMKFAPILYIRYWEKELEVFVADMKVTDDFDGWDIVKGGEWIPYEDAMADTCFILDQLELYIEESDCYGED